MLLLSLLTLHLVKPWSVFLIRLIAVKMFHAWWRFIGCSLFPECLLKVSSECQKNGLRDSVLLFAPPLTLQWQCKCLQVVHGLDYPNQSQLRRCGSNETSLCFWFCLSKIDWPGKKMINVFVCKVLKLFSSSMPFLSDVHKGLNHPALSVDAYRPHLFGRYSKRSRQSSSPIIHISCCSLHWDI